MTDWPDTTRIHPGPFEGVNASVGGFSFAGKAYGYSLTASKSVNVSFADVKFTGTFTGKFEDRAWGLNLWDTNISAKGSYNALPADFSRVGLGTGISLSISGDSAAATLTLLGKPLDVRVDRGNVEEGLLRALEQRVPGITADPRIKHAVSLVAGLVEPALGGIHTQEIAIQAELESAYRLLAGRIDGLPSIDAKCFPASTPIRTSLTTSAPISRLRPNDTVLAYDPRANRGRGALVARRVTRLYRNTTTEWVRLRWGEGGAPRELVCTPGHHFLDQFGSFPTIAQMLRDGSATVVLASGELAEVTAERSWGARARRGRCALAPGAGGR